MLGRTIGGGSSSDRDMETPEEQWARFKMAAERGDMRIEVAKRAINQGALAGMGSEISDYAAWLVIDALDSFDADADQRAYAQGFRQGLAFREFREAQR
jgi:hypothetical protein